MVVSQTATAVTYDRFVDITGADVGACRTRCRRAGCVIGDRLLTTLNIDRVRGAVFTGDSATERVPLLEDIIDAVAVHIG